MTAFVAFLNQSWLFVLLLIIFVVILLFYIIFYFVVNRKKREKYWKHKKVHLKQTPDQPNKPIKNNQQTPTVIPTSLNIDQDETTLKWNNKIQHLIETNPPFVRLLKSVDVPTDYFSLNHVGAEEKVRIKFLTYLQENFHVNYENMVLELEIPNGSQKLRGDIGLFTNDCLYEKKTFEHVKTIVELKKAGVSDDVVKQAVKQLKSYLTLTPNSKYGIVWCDDINKAVFLQKKLTQRNNGTFITEFVELNSFADINFLEYSGV